MSFNQKKKKKKKKTCNQYGTVHCLLQSSSARWNIVIRLSISCLLAVSFIKRPTFTFAKAAKDALAMSLARRWHAAIVLCLTSGGGGGGGI